MGIDYRVESLTHPTMFAIDSPEQYCKWAWRDIKWAPVLDFLDINLSLLTGCAIHWWAESQVAEMRDLIRQLAEGDENLLWDEERKAAGGSLRKDAQALLKHFDFYVAHDARIWVI